MLEGQCRKSGCRAQVSWVGFRGTRNAFLRWRGAGNSTEEKRNRIKRRKGDNARGSKPPQRGLREGEKALNEG